MKKELLNSDKELLLKDLCGRLPYSVKISVPELWTSEKKIEVLNEIFKGDDCLYRVNDNGIIVEYVKPYLFPLSSMTKEQEEELLAILEDKSDDEFEYKVVDFYNKYHFDYRGLIPMGLAIDATGLNIY